jgi:hypothetical protein
MNLQLQLESGRVQLKFEIPNFKMEDGEDGMFDSLMV